MFTFSIPLMLNPIVIDGYPKPAWYHYVFAFVIAPTLSWLAINFGLKKMKEDQEKNQNESQADKK